MYKTRVPTIPIYLFVIDTSYASSANGLVYAFCSVCYFSTKFLNFYSYSQAMQRILPSLFAESNIPIGFITYDDRVSVYLIDPALPSPSVAVMPDINKPFSPSTGIILDAFIFINTPIH
ncbi:hypothetical protein M1146_04350 [Patescibacteria group bacterium]|nr:hypothetical protein [Patescibacteria group bacterium]